MSPNSKDAPDNQKNIANVVGKHADRVMDGLFSEIEELLSGDLQEKSPPGSLSAAAPMAARKTAPQSPPVTPGSIAQQQPLAQTPSTGIAAPAPAPTKTGGGFWKKLLAGTGILVLLGGGGLWWLQKQGKIDLSAITALGSGNNSDAQFSDYLRRSFTKIEGNASAVPTVPSAAEPAIPNPPAESSAVPAPTAAAATVSASFLKIIAGTPPLAEFSIDGQPQQLKSGDPIGTSGWTVGSVSITGDNEVIVKRNGEIRSLKTGDKL
jgi:hypothetical protein